MPRAFIGFRRRRLRKNAIFAKTRFPRDSPLSFFRTATIALHVEAIAETSAIRSCSPGYERDTEVALFSNVSASRREPPPGSRRRPPVPARDPRRRARELPDGDAPLEDADGQATALDGVAAVILTADCLPVLLAASSVAATSQTDGRCPSPLRRPARNIAGTVTTSNCSIIRVFVSET